MYAAIAHNLAHLFDLGGGEPRPRFWRWFAFIVVLNLLVALVASIPTMITAVEAGTAAMRAGGREAAELAVTERMVGLAENLVWVGLAVAAGNIVLLGAALFRRLHDAGLPGFLILVPLALQLVWMYFSWSQLGGLAATIRDAASVQQSGGTVAVAPGMIAQDLIGWLAVVVVILIGLLGSHAAPATGTAEGSQSAAG